MKRRETPAPALPERLRVFDPAAWLRPGEDESDPRSRCITTPESGGPPSCGSVVRTRRPGGRLRAPERPRLPVRDVFVTGPRAVQRNTTSRFDAVTP
jgi:hypothetical protein